MKYENNKQMIIDIKKMVKWKDREALERLLESKILIPLPKGMLHGFHNPDECYKCGFKEWGLIGLWYVFSKRLKARFK